MILRDKCILLTGATGGIGAAVASLLAGAGGRLLLTARDPQRLAVLQNDLSAAGACVEVIAGDLTTAVGRERIVAAATDFGGVDVLVNSAGTTYFGLFTDQSAASVESLIATNVVAPLLLIRELLPLLSRAREAAIVNVGSALGSIGMPGQAAYAASKFALRGFSEALRRELIGTNVQVLYVAPRTTDTAMNDPFAREVSERMGNCSDSAQFVAMQLVDALAFGRRERFIGWPERLAIKLNALLPFVLDRVLARQTRLIRDAAQPRGVTPLTLGARQ